MISPLIQNWRKMLAFESVSQKQAQPNSVDQASARTSMILAEANRAGTLDAKTVALWRMEGIGVTMGRWCPAVDLGMRFPHQSRGIIHVGIGGGLVTNLGFNAEYLKREIEMVADPGFALYCYEGIGHMAGLQRGTPYSEFMRWSVGMPIVRCINPAWFLAQFSADLRDRIELGLGRLIYFTSWSLETAIRTIENLAYLDVRSAVHGAAFAYCMVNHQSLPAVEGLLHSDELLDYSAEAQWGISDGIKGALEFWATTFPAQQDVSKVGQTAG